MRRSPHQLISGRAQAQTKVPHATLRGQKGLQGGWDPSLGRRLAATPPGGHASTLEWYDDRLGAGSPAGRLYGECLADALAVYLLNRYSVRCYTPLARKGGLPGYRLK